MSLLYYRSIQEDSGEVNSTTAKGLALRAEGQADLGLHKRHMTSDCGRVSYAWDITHTLRIALSPSP